MVAKTGILLTKTVIPKLLVYGIVMALVSSTGFPFCTRVRIKKESVCDVVDAFDQSKYVFVGTVVEKYKETYAARMHIVKTFKGEAGETIDIHEDIVCYYGPSLDEGKQYLIYAITSPTGVAMKGERSSRIDDADADLQLIKKLIAGRTPGYIGGKIRQLPDEWTDSAGYRLLYDKGYINESEYRPIGKVQVKIKNSKVEFNTITNEQGQYSLFDLPSDIYYIEPFIEGYTVKVAPDYVWLSEDGCAEANLLLQANQ
jgi:hypothetical protein